MSSETPAAPAVPAFRDLALSPAVLKAVEDVGYESPSPIQAATIPHLLAGRDVLGQAQTGTGKTAAFALPILSGLDLKAGVQSLVLVPTRELAIQVAEAFRKYAGHLEGFHVLPIYGGQSYEPQLARLRRGVHVVVGTPGRVMDHMKRGTLKLDGLRHLVLDEADEMLRMGFIDDVEWVLEQTPAGRQIALFSATMPPQIRRIAERHLKDPASVTIRSRTSTATNIRQRYLLVGGHNKLEALTRLLEVETFDGLLVFTRTKQATTELAERLEARGFAAAALNGDIPQALRERTVARLKSGQLDIVVATDVAARGLDVERVSHVINFDIPYDTESYVHRIGRTGRAGRSGEAILFVTHRERNMLRIIERATRQPIDPMELPTPEAVNDIRVGRFLQKITEARATPSLGGFRSLVERYAAEHDLPMAEVAAALAVLAQGDPPLDLRVDSAGGHAADEHPVVSPDPGQRPERPAARVPDVPPREREQKRERRPPRSEGPPRHEAGERSTGRPEDRAGRREPGMETYRVAVGRVHGVRPANIVGAIASEAGLEGSHIGRIDIQDDFTLVDLPEGMPKQIFRDLQKVWVAGQQLKIRRVADEGAPVAPRPFRKDFERRPGKPPAGRPGRPAGKRPGKPPGRPRRFP